MADRSPPLSLWCEWACAQSALAGSGFALGVELGAQPRHDFDTLLPLSCSSAALASFSCLFFSSFVHFG